MSKLTIFNLLHLNTGKMKSDHQGVSKKNDNDVNLPFSKEIKIAFVRLFPKTFYGSDPLYVDKGNPEEHFKTYIK